MHKGEQTLGLVQMFHTSPAPEMLATRLLDVVLEDFCETAGHYMLHLVFSHSRARRHGTAQEVVLLDEQIATHFTESRLPILYQLELLLGDWGYRQYGAGIFPFWSAILIQLCTMEQRWEGILLGLEENTYQLPGFQSDAPTWSPAWLNDFRKVWTKDLKRVYPELSLYLL